MTAIQPTQQIMLSFLAEYRTARRPNTSPAAIFATAPRDIRLVSMVAFHPLSSASMPDAAFMELPTADDTK